MESAIYSLTNEERSRMGLAPLARSPALNFLAKKQSHHMCSSRILRHESNLFPVGWRTFKDRIRMVGITLAGENIAYYSILRDSRRWGKLVLQGWMRSPTHRKNILNSDYSFIGIGVVPCEGRIAFVTQLLASEKGRLQALR